MVFRTRKKGESEMNEIVELMRQFGNSLPLMVTITVMATYIGGMAAETILKKPKGLLAIKLYFDPQLAVIAMFASMIVVVICGISAYFAGDTAVVVFALSAVIGLLAS